MEDQLKTGIIGSEILTVNQTNTASAMGSGDLAVFATPAMVALMEKTAAESVAPFIGSTVTTVGTALNVAHTAASAVGMKIRCESELVGIDGRRLTFKVRAFDDVGEIGSGTHERFIVDRERFMSKTESKLKK